MGFVPESRKETGMEVGSGHSAEQKSMLDGLREKQPDATEREAWLLQRLIGAMGMIRAETARRGSIYSWDWNQPKDAYEQFNDWLLEQYGWRLEWHKREAAPKKPRRKTS